MEVLFAPDWRDGVPYQRLLAEALARHEVGVSFLRNYRRVFPLWRLLRDWTREHRCDVLHLHWPEAYYPQKGGALDWFRCARFSFDLRQAIRSRALAITAHNLHAHNRPNEPFAFHNTGSAFRQAQAVFAHSEAAKALLLETYGLDPERITVIPHGDLSVVLGPPRPREEARAALGLGAEKVCLMFGAVEPYKGIEDVIAFWRDIQPDCTLVIAGKPCSAEYGSFIAKLALIDRVVLRLGWLADEQLRWWLSAADAALFNYRTIFTSGAANLARSYGLPQLLPARLSTVALGEPAPSVFRFDSLAGDFSAKLAAACAAGLDYAGAADWRKETSWDRVAELTAAAYRRAAECAGRV